MTVSGWLDRSAIVVAPSRPFARKGLSRRTSAARRRRRGRRLRLLAGVVILAVAAATWTVLAPVPFLDAYLTRKVTAEIAGRMTCPGSTAAAPQITLGGGRLLPQLLHGRLTQIRLSVPDTPLGGARHAAFAATLQGVHPLTSAAQRADRLDASVFIRFADLPVPPGTPRPSFARSADGSLTITVTPTREQAKQVSSVLNLKLVLHGETLTAVPQSLRLFGHLLPARSVTTVTGGARTQTLPKLPDGLHYTSVSPQPDGLHVTLDGVVTTPLSALPTAVGDQTVSYLAKDGLLGIATSVQVPPIVDEPLTIFTEPRLDGGTLTLVPRSVEVLGENRPPDDPIAGIVLDQVKPQDLTRTLPVLPPGVRYRSVTVDSGGVKVAVGGTVVKPLAQLPAGNDGLQVTFGARDGLLTATSRGMSSHGTLAPTTLYAHPRIVGSTLDVSPESIQMFGALFPAADVLAEMKLPSTAYPLQALTPGLRYSGVEVLPTGLRILVTGTNVPLSTGGLLGGAGCRPASTPTVNSARP